MSSKSRPGWIIGRALFVVAASALGGCAATPLSDSRGAENASPSQKLESPISPGQPQLNAWHALRSVMANLHDAGIYFDVFYLGPVLVPAAP
jgi:hypothetical protein